MSVLSFPSHQPGKPASPPVLAPPPVPPHPLARRGARPSRPAGAHAEGARRAREPSQVSEGKTPLYPCTFPQWQRERGERTAAASDAKPGKGTAGFSPKPRVVVVSKGGEEESQSQPPRYQPTWGFSPFREPPPGEEGEGGAGEEEARWESDARRRRCAAAEEERVREGPVEEEGDVRVRSGAGPEQRDARRRVRRRRTAKPATPSPPTHGEHRGLPSFLLALFAFFTLPVGVPSSRQCLGAPRRRLPKDDAAPCSAGKVQGRGNPKPCAPDEPVRAEALGCPAGELRSSYPCRAAPSSLDARARRVSGLLFWQ
jgi:hypothetical protein